MHGLVLWGAYFLLTERIELAVVAMVLAVNFKQMALYFGLPFAVYTLSSLWSKAALRYRGNRLSQLSYVSFRLAILAVVFALTMALLWLPWIKESMSNGWSSPHGVMSVTSRIFPVRRGLFEDKVASFWCVLNNFVKVHVIFDQPR